MKRAAAHRRPGTKRGVAAYRRTPEREQTIRIGWPSVIGGRQHDNAALPVRYVGIKSQALTMVFCSSTAAELQFTINPAIDVAAVCFAAPRRNVEADSAAPWQRAPPLDDVQVPAVRAAWHLS